MNLNGNGGFSKSLIRIKKSEVKIFYLTSFSDMSNFIEVIILENVDSFILGVGGDEKEGRAAIVETSKELVGAREFFMVVKAYECFGYSFSNSVVASNSSLTLWLLLWDYSYLRS